VLDLDIKGFFDSIDHELMMRAVRKHTEEKWVLLYIERWLTAPVAYEDGHEEERSKGTPQGGVISPLLANLFLHYAFDEWMGEITAMPMTSSATARPRSRRTGS
jgi:RNA-directed DNA polymerase